MGTGFGGTADLQAWHSDVDPTSKRIGKDQPNATRKMRNSTHAVSHTAAIGMFEQVGLSQNGSHKHD